MKPLNEEELEKIRDGKLIISWAMQAGKITFARLIATIDQRDERIIYLEGMIESFKSSREWQSMEKMKAKNERIKELMIELTDTKSKLALATAGLEVVKIGLKQITGE